MCKNHGGKRELHLLRIHYWVQYSWSLGECGLMVDEDKTGRLKLFEEPQYKNRRLITGVGYLF